jgi:uncharacterized GH25 family protein
MRLGFFLAALTCMIGASALSAHDTWVQTNTNLIRAGDLVHIDLLLGNHGNNHRDFKLAGKADVSASTLQVTGPNGKSIDLKDRLADVGYTSAEGYWTARFTATEPGLYVVGHTFDKVMNYAPVRAIKSAKTYFLVSKTLDRVSNDNPGFDRPLGHKFELIPQTNPVAPMGPGVPIKVKLLFDGKPLPNCQVSFIPRGDKLTEKFDETYERKTDSEGTASFTPTTGNYYLVVAHWHDANAGGPNFKSTKYSATLTVYVPQVCPCCE